MRKKEGKCLLKVKMPDRYGGVCRPLICNGGKHNNLHKRQLTECRARRNTTEVSTTERPRYNIKLISIVRIIGHIIQHKSNFNQL